MDGGSPSACAGDGGEDPSAALDQLFLELHDQLSKDVRGKFAKLADEVKKLTEASTSAAQTTPPLTPPTSSELVRREEGIVEARQSSGELAQGVVVTSLSDQPTLKDIVCFAVPHVALKWYDVGIVLDVKTFVLDGVAHEQERADRPREMFVKWLQKCAGTGNQARTWRSVLDAIGVVCGQGAVEEIQTAVQVPRCPTTDEHEETTTTEQSSALEPQRKRRRSSTQSSEEHELERQPNVKKWLHEYMELKMDLFDQDISDLCCESDPGDIIRLLYFNSLTVITNLLKPYLVELKTAAGKYYQLSLHRGEMAGVIASAESVHSLLSRMSVTGMWDKTIFLKKAVDSIPQSAPERGIAQAVLSHYNLHLAIYKRATLLKDALAKESESKEEGKSAEENTQLVPLKITSMKAYDTFTCEDCHRLQARILSTAYGIPEEKIICRDIEERQSTTVTFLVPNQYVNSIMQRCSQLETVWILLELDIMEVSIPGVFTFPPSVGCFLTLLRGRNTFTADLLRVTEILPYQTYCLIDSVTKHIPVVAESIDTVPLVGMHLTQATDLVAQQPAADSFDPSQALVVALDNSTMHIPLGVNDLIPPLEKTGVIAAVHKDKVYHLPDTYSHKIED